MSQKIEKIKIEDLVLWTENPRDPIDPNSNDQDITDKAWKDDHDKWNLLKLAKEMREFYDFSELPTVVYYGNKPVVYDGNRRMILAKLKHDLVKLPEFDKTKLPHIPKIIPCNVCDKEIAIKNVFRKHGNSGTWSPLDRDIFLHKHMNEPKSTFLKIEDATGIISNNPHLNQRFVKEEIFTNQKLKEMGFEFNQDDLESKHSKSEAKTIFDDISSKVAAKVIHTRKNRGKVIEVLDKSSRSLIETNKKKPLTKIHINATGVITPLKKKQAPRTKKREPEIFNGKLYLKPGQVSDLYRDIVDLYGFYQQKKDTFSQYFPSLVRMSLRLLGETAATDNQLPLDKYLKKNYKNAKKNLDKDAKTTLSTQNVTEGSLTQLLHIGAHNYQASNNLDQTIAISIILGEILTITHGR
ncbi:hypothetical protein [Maribacter polysaccharolyticus]|uniref:hypothetical protein n=1 Tax=Maribacter polysaccharolyticus TaxID=3020831 RepID=UPI00237EECB6|nr:hypothetical protein [Maribacter polysaccharolyticus]MDE3741773.1 hypothetical protein [Maribacter polysaccharolyticus]